MIEDRVYSSEIAKKSKIVIIGLAQTGKTTFTNQLKQDPVLKDFTFFHTDNYGDKYGHEPGLYVLIDELKSLEQQKLGTIPFVSLYYLHSFPIFSTFLLINLKGFIYIKKSIT